MSINEEAVSVVQSGAVPMDRAQAVQIVHYLQIDGLLTPAPQIIRNKTELGTLDPDTVLIDSDGEVMDAGLMQKNLSDFGHMSLRSNPFPAVVITTAEQVRAAYAYAERNQK